MNGWSRVNERTSPLTRPPTAASPTTPTSNTKSEKPLAPEWVAMIAVVVLRIPPTERSIPRV